MTPEDSLAQLHAEVNKVAVHLLHLFQDQHLDSINNRFIHPVYGVYYVYRPGAIDRYAIFTRIKYSDDPEMPSPYNALFCIPPAYYAEQPEWHHARYNCDDMTWDRKGLFISDSLDYPSITRIMDFETEYEEIKHPKKEYEQAAVVEKNSYRVVLTKYNIIFCLTSIDGQWYITLIDKVTTVCGA